MTVAGEACVFVAMKQHPEDFLIAINQPKG